MGPSHEAPVQLTPHRDRLALVQGSIRRCVLLAFAAAIVLVPACAEARITTTVTIFRAFTPDGSSTIPTRLKSGSCFVGALTTNRNDAWRCLIGNFIYDPCFSSAQAPGIVICPDATLHRGIEIQLTKGLPRHFGNKRPPSVHGQPWKIELAGGRHCIFLTGATGAVHGVRLNYACDRGAKFALWGFPSRRTEPWTILTAPFNATRLHARSAIRSVLV
jgi:hypothetical protein